MIRKLLCGALSTAFFPASIACSSNCTPIDDGGVLVDVTGIADCTRLTASARDASGEHALDTFPTPERSDAGTLCSFLGIRGYTGTFTITVTLDGAPAASESVTLAHTDSCNIAGEYVKFDLANQ